jgi:hypothetical protein
MKLDEWNIRKNRRKNKSQCEEGHSNISSVKSVSGTSESCSSPGTPNSSIGGDLHTPNESSPTAVLGSPGISIEISYQPYQLETAPNPFPNEPPSDNNDLGPIVNSSLMFFSFRTDSQSLQLLAKFPGMAPRAIEILLRNWKPGGDYMHYALRFLKDSAYCHTLLSVNWTRWTDQDETLFDLIDAYVPEDEQVTLTKAILRADLTFQYPLEPLHAAWASRWRLALQQTEWQLAKGYLVRLRAHSRLIDCALYVVGESIVRRQTQIIHWDGITSDCSTNIKGQILQVLSDRRDLQADWKHRLLFLVATGVCI